MKTVKKEKSPSLNLLIAEDEEMLREILVDALEPLGCNLYVAENGETALELLKSKAGTNPISAVLTDINMPKITGFGFMEAALAHGFHIPFVFLTAYGDKENVVRALRLGAFDFLEKPFNQKHLLEVLERALKVGAQINENETQLLKLFAQSGLPESKRQEFLRTKRAIEQMKIENDSLKSPLKKKSA